MGFEWLLCTRLSFGGLYLIIQDRFLSDFLYCCRWECLAEILASDLTNGILCDIGLPVEERGVRYNCRAFCLDGQILLIRPKLYLANDGNYRELRWFSAWKRLRQLDTLQLPECIKQVTGQETVPFGDGYLSFEDTWVALLFSACNFFISFTYNLVYLSSDLFNQGFMVWKWPIQLIILWKSIIQIGPNFIS